MFEESFRVKISIANQHYHPDTSLRLAKKLLWGLQLPRGLLGQGWHEIPQDFHGLHVHVSDIPVTLEPYQHPKPDPDLAWHPKYLQGRGTGPRLPWLLHQMDFMGNE